MSGWCGWPIFENLNIVLLLNFIFVSENHITVVAVAGWLEERSKAGLEGRPAGAIAVILAHRIIAAIAVIIVISSITTL